MDSFDSNSFGVVARLTRIPYLYRCIDNEDRRWADDYEYGLVCMAFSTVFGMMGTLILLLSLLVAFGIQETFSFSQRPALRRGQDKNFYENGPTQKGFTERTVVLLYHKPANVVTSHVSDDSRTTVYDEILSMKGFASSSTTPMGSNDKSFEQATRIYSKLHAIGRLDADTTGLLLLTNDGGLVHHVTNRNALTHDQMSSTSGPITKTYEALIMGHHDAKSLQPLWEGVDIGSKYGGMTRPVDDLQILDHPNHKSTLVSITISEGKNRQIRRMFHSLGSGVMKLKRTKIGNFLTLDEVDEGSWRILSDDEVRHCLGWEARNLDDKALVDPRRQKVTSRFQSEQLSKKKYTQSRPRDKR